MSEEQMYANLQEDRYTKVFESRGIKSGREAYVKGIKLYASHLLGIIDQIPIEPENSECSRLISLAKTSLEESVMWGVKAVSRS